MSNYLKLTRFQGPVNQSCAYRHNRNPSNLTVRALYTWPFCKAAQKGLKVYQRLDCVAVNLIPLQLKLRASYSHPTSVKLKLSLWCRINFVQYYLRRKSCYRYKMDTSMNADSEETYKKILLKNGINTPVKNVSIKIPNMHGDQFASQCKLVTVEFADGTIPKLELFVKAAITIGEYAETMRDVLMFEKEAQYFSKLLPEMEEFAKAQQGYDGFLEGLLPKCYYASDVLIVFENLTYQGFAMLNKLVLHDFQIAEAVFRTLAKFHGISLAFFHHIGEENFLTKYSLIASKSIMSEAGEVLYGGWMETGIDGAIKILSSKPTPGSDKVLEYLKQYETRGFLRLCKLLTLDNQSCSMSLNHGDLWNGNVMFKMNAETKKPESCLMLDLQ
ncbi:unnamed protein product, partial [Allacma fusca]